MTSRDQTTDQSNSSNSSDSSDSTDKSDQMTSSDTVQQALATFPIIDGHKDCAWECRVNRDYSVDGLERGLASDTDIARLRAGGVGAQFWSVWVEDAVDGALAVQQTLEQIDWVYRLAARYPEDFAIATSAADVERASADGRIASLLGAEGAHSLNDSPAVLRMLARLGVRYLTLTHVKNSSWADSATDEAVHGGLSPRGIEYIAELNRLGVLADLSHVSPATMHATLDATTSPVIFSHSSCRALSDHPRNVPDDVLERLAANGGVIMITFVPQFLSADFQTWFDSDRTGDMPVVSIADVADHVDHARSVAGVAHIGLGGDFDGTEFFPAGLEGVDGYPALLTELADRGWSADDLAALAGGNILRVLRETDALFATGGAGRPALEF